MHANEKLLTSFYEALQNRDHVTMQACYADQASFSDPVFTCLNAAEVRAMWEMLLTRGKDLALTFRNIRADDRSGSAECTATYTFTATGRKVTNHIRSEFELADGKILRQRDSFDFHRWARQALGLSGLLLGWTGFFQNKVRAGAMKSLKQFMQPNR
ncbi:MAG: nuclear transport factor 2 family protein [Bacteroidetes bacterium]|nr:MAG: nuclear transport factor 2 family protein [Bacteroidota bacterium]